MPDQKPNHQKPAPESDLNDTPPPDDETSSEPITLTSETSDTVETEEESTAPIADEESETEANQELAEQDTISKGDYWLNFKSSMLLAMLEMMGNLQLQTAVI